MVGTLSDSYFNNHLVMIFNCVWLAVAKSLLNLDLIYPSDKSFFIPFYAYFVAIKKS